MIFIIGSNTSAQHPLVYARVADAKKHRGARLLVADPRRTAVAGLADSHLQLRPGSNLALVNAMMHVILEEGLENTDFIHKRTENIETLRESLKPCTPEWAETLTGLPPDTIREAARIYAHGPNSTILYCMGVTQHVTGTRTCAALANLVMLCGMIGRPATGLNPLRGQNNVQGSCDMGALPDSLPGYVKAGTDLAVERFRPFWGEFANTAGRTLTEIMTGMATGEIRSTYIIGENPVQSDPDSTHVEEGLKKLDFLLVQDLFMTPTARLAHVILPAASYLEKTGTFTNTERRVQMVNEVVPPLSGTLPDWRILTALIRNLGGFGIQAEYDSPEDILNEIRQVVPSYAGMTYQRLTDAQGLCWPCPTTDHPGTPCLHTETFPRGRGLFTVNDVPDATYDDVCTIDSEYPLTLITGRVAHHYHTGTMTRRAWALERESPEAFLEIHPDDAAAFALKENWKIRITSRQGSITARVRTTPDIRPGVVFLPFHFEESSANILTSHTPLDPTAKIPPLKTTAVRIEEA